MKYLIFDTEESVNVRNNEIAKAQGCDTKPEDCTKYWFAVVKHPEQDKWALCVDDESLLTGQERAGLKSESEMTGWFEDTGEA